MPKTGGVWLEIQGLFEAQQQFEQAARAMQGDAMLNAIRSSTLLVEADAKRNAPVDTGRLRASITPTVRVEGKVVQGVVGSNVVYAPFMELGTRPHWPPIAALEVWARRHGTSAFVVARSIAVKGLKARKFLQNALIKNAAAIRAKIRAAVKSIFG